MVHAATTTNASPASALDPSPIRLRGLLETGVGIFALTSVILAAEIAAEALFRLPGLLAKPFTRRKKAAKLNAENYQRSLQRRGNGTCTTHMCPIKPGASMPTKPGVYWRDTAQWVEYTPQQSALIMDGYNALHQAECIEKNGNRVGNPPNTSQSPFTRPPSPRTPPRGIGGGVVAGGLTAETPRGNRTANVDLGRVVSAAHPRGCTYTVDLRRGVQVSERGFAREVLVVLQTTPREHDRGSVSTRSRSVPSGVSKLLNFQCMRLGSVQNEHPSGDRFNTYRSAFARHPGLGRGGEGRLLRENNSTLFTQLSSDRK